MLKNSEKVPGWTFGHSMFTHKIRREKKFCCVLYKKTKTQKNVFVPQKISFLREILYSEVECLDVQNI
jgi:hypothetical protein